MKNTLMLSIACAFLIFGGACFTPLLYDEPIKANRSFTEEVASFLITEDGKKLIVIGKNHHYIFTANDTLKFIMHWSERKRVKASFSSFNIKNDQSLTGSYKLTIPIQTELPSEIRQQLIAKGFTHNPRRKTLSYQGTLQGQRYVADQFKIPNSLMLNKTYRIHMTEASPLSATRVVKRIVLTPLAVAADGLLLLGGAPIYLFSLMLN
jgi:hypothetical protein